MGSLYGGMALRCNTEPMLMQRRTLLKLGLGASLAVTLAGAAWQGWRPGWRDGRLTDAGRAIFAAVGRAVLDGFWPAQAAERAQAAAQHLDRVERSIAGLAPATRAELSQLLAVLAGAPGRWALTGLARDWADASTEELQAMLQGLRVSPSQTRRQVYHALRDLSTAAYFADPATWTALGYPGPRTL